MGKRLYLLIAFLITSFLLLFISLKFNSPFDFISGLFSSPRVFLYSAVHAGTQTSELEKLKKENLRLREELSKLYEIKKDNSALRSQFEETLIPSQNLLPSSIVGFKGNLSNPTAFILNRGENSGVKKGMAVISGKSLVGKIGKVTQNNSEVLLLINSKFSTLGQSSQNTASGVVTGQEDFIILDHVAITDTLILSEDIVTKGEEDLNGAGIPPGLIIGKIEKINKIETKPFQDAILKSPINFKKLTTVFVVIN